MYHYFILNRFLCPALFIFLLTTSFKNHPVDKKGITKTTVISNHNDPGQNRAMAFPAPDDLYVLKISGSDFRKLKTDKWIFKFIHVREDVLTLHGWYANGLSGRSFDTPHEIELEPTKTNVLKYSTDMYFGDIVLKRKDVRKIKKLIKTKNVETVLFKPHLNPAPHVSYEITLITVNKATLRETFEANPSPPKGFQ